MYIVMGDRRLHRITPALCNSAEERSSQDLTMLVVHVEREHCCAPPFTLCVAALVSASVSMFMRCRSTIEFEAGEFHEYAP